MLQLSGEPAVQWRRVDHNVLTPESWENVLRTLQLRSTNDYYQRQRRAPFADDDAVSLITGSYGICLLLLCSL